MYLLTQLAIFLFLAFALGIAVGYGLWRLWGQRQQVAKYNAAEMRLASYLSRVQSPAAAAEFQNLSNT